MIYLLEDRRDRFEQLLKVKLDKERINTDAKITCTKEEIEAYVVDNFSDAKLVLIHRSYNFSDSSITPIYLQNIFNAHSASVVIFSGDSSSNISKNNGTINSQDLYANLPWFVSQNDETNISKLIFGERYLLNSLITFQGKVYDKLFDFEDSKLLGQKEIEELKFLLPYLKAPELAHYKESLKEKLFPEKIVTVGDFKNFLQRIIDKQ